MAETVTITSGAITIEMNRPQTGDANLDRMLITFFKLTIGSVASFLNSLQGGGFTPGAIGDTDLATDVKVGSLAAVKIPSTLRANVSGALNGILAGLSTIIGGTTVGGGMITDHGAHNSKVDVTAGSYLNAAGEIHSFPAATALAVTDGQKIWVDVTDDTVKAGSTLGANVQLANVAVSGGDVTIDQGSTVRIKIARSDEVLAWILKVVVANGSIVFHDMDNSVLALHSNGFQDYGSDFILASSYYGLSLANNMGVYWSADGTFYGTQDTSIVRKGVKMIGLPVTATGSKIAASGSTYDGGIIIADDGKMYFYSNGKRYLVTAAEG